MTKEELKLEALKYLENFKDCANCKHRWGDCADELDEDCLINNCYSATPKEQDIYLAGAEPREKQIQALGERCLQLQKDKGELTDRVKELEDKLANADYQLEGRDNEIKELKAQIEKMKQDLDSAREEANRQEQWEIYSVLNNIYNDNFEVITSVSN